MNTVCIGKTVYFYGVSSEDNTMQIRKGVVMADYGSECWIESDGFNLRIGRNELSTKKELTRLPIYFGQFLLMRGAATATATHPVTKQRLKEVAKYWRDLVIANAEGWQQNRRQLKRQREQIAFANAIING